MIRNSKASNVFLKTIIRIHASSIKTFVLLAKSFVLAIEEAKAMKVKILRLYWILRGVALLWRWKLKISYFNNLKLSFFIPKV